MPNRGACAGARRFTGVASGTRMRSTTMFSTWFRRTQRPAQTFLPTVCVLEDRTVPALFRNFLPPVPAPLPATHLAVIVPQDVESGKAFSVIVEAEDAKNHVVAGF